MPYFMTYDANNKAVNVAPISELDAGNYTFSVEVQKTKAPSMFNIYTFNVEVKPAN